MKEFIKYTFATVVGLILFTIVASVFCIISMAGMLASDQMGAAIEKNSILRINLSGTIEEQAQDDPLSILMGDEDKSIGLNDLLTAIQRAKENKNVKGIYLEGGAPVAAPATLQEIRQAIADFKKSGKFIYAYADQYTQGGYYICSLADTLMVNPQGGIDWHGLASEPIFYKDVLEKVGIKMQVFKVGTYKSAVEPYTCTEMSDANREQVTAFLSGIWNQMKKEVAASRRLSAERMDALADSFLLLHPTTKLVEWKVADKLTYIDEVKTLLKEKMKLDDDDNLNFVSIKDMVNADDPDHVDSDDEIAIYYAYGDIVDNASSSSLATSHQIVGSRMVEDLKNLRTDDDVKAVVIRVNSGGGSAYASEQIWREVELLKAEKPVIISMGGMAASGGYYISCAANQIFAEPTTLTGSIGIFGMIPDVSELTTQKIGLKYDVVKTNALSDFGTSSRGMNATESNLLQAHIERGYETFTGRVAMGRKMKLEAVKAIAEGRVWTGEQALKNGLVDRLGNLEDAIRYAAKLAKLDSYSTDTYPGEEAWYSRLLNKKKSGYLQEEMRNTLGEYYTAFDLIRTLKAQSPLQMRIPFDPNIR